MTAAAANAESSPTEESSDPAKSAKLKFASRTALSLTLAYLIPMAWGWPQPQTAAITVMLIAATGSLSESLQKGVLRTFGTVAGAAVGLTLIALFPQDRMLYLLVISIFITVALYLYNAYQGDSTVFMLTIVVSLMVFNGGDADGAFIYGIDRTLLTVFGVLIYSLVGSFLWPVKIANNLSQQAAAVSTAFARSAQLLGQPIKGEQRKAEETQALELLLTSLENFRQHYIAVKNDAEGVKAYQQEWNAIFACYENLESIVVPGLRSTDTSTPDFKAYIVNYSALLGNITAQLAVIDKSWTSDTVQQQLVQIPVSYKGEQLQEQSHLTIAAIVNRGQLLEKLQALLSQLIGAINSLRFDQGNFDRDTEVVSAPSFIWLDRENLKTAVRGFFTFWLATFIWIQFNPPGGFMFVTLCVALVPLVSFTPVTPKLLIFLLSFGFMFALPAYVFLLPAMTHWLQLALFLFSYAFLGFFLFPGPVAIFFLLGLFTLGIQNTMSYNFNVIALIILMFYMVCALLIISVHFPFTSAPEKLYRDFRRRFFILCGKIMRAGPPDTVIDRTLNALRLSSAAALLSKMQLWGEKIDSDYFPGSSTQNIHALNHSCENLLGRLRALTGPLSSFADNPIITTARREVRPGIAADLCDTLATADNPDAIEQVYNAVREDLSQVEQQLGLILDGEGDTLWKQQSAEDNKRQDMASFYIYINLHASILVSLEQCRCAQIALDWRQLRGKKF